MVRFAFQNIRDTFAGVAVAVGITGAAHFEVRILIVEQFCKALIDRRLLCADKAQRSRRDAFGALRSIPHDKHGLAVAWALLLNAAGVGQAEMAARLKVVAIEHVKRFDDMDLRTVLQLFLRRLSDERIHVDGIDRPTVGMFVQNPPDRAEHPVHRFAQILPAVGGDEDKPVITRPFQLGMEIVFLHGMPHGVDDRVAGNVDGFRVLPLPDKIVGGELRWGEIVAADDPHRLAVELLRVRGVDVIGSQPGLHMADRDLQVEAGQRGSEGGRRVAVNENNVGAFRLQNCPNAAQDILCNIKKVLSVLHDIQVIIRDDPKGVQHLIQHLPVLGGDTDLDAQTGTLSQFQHERTHFNGLRSGAEDAQCFFHCPINSV